MAMSFDFLVIGSGCAGLEFSLGAAQFGSVGIITKKNKAESNTNYAQGGIASVLSPDDSYEQHMQDTLIAGAGLCDPEAVEIIVKEGPAIIEELIRHGANFTKSNGTLDLIREGGHGQKRIIHSRDSTGREIEMTLLDAVEKHANITMLEHHFALELITEHHLGRKVTRHITDKHCFGAYVLDTNSGNILTVLARATLLATGGSGRIYQHTTNPEIATGDGIAMAYRAKARVANMEFIQFHPTTLYAPGAGSFLISEAVRGHGGLLRNSAGHLFMAGYDTRRELAPRDIVARAIDDQLKKSGDECVFLDITHLDGDQLKSSFPTIYATCIDHGIDITRDLIPVVPAAHYTCGGVWTDHHGRTTIQGLYAAGEVACTGVHGANRLASNSLLEALVFAKRAASSASEYICDIEFEPNIPDWDDSGTSATEEWILISHNKKELQQIMWDYVGIVRSDLRLQRAFRRTRLLYDEVEDYYKRNTVSESLCQLRNMIAVSYLVIRCAMMRKESRGLHFSTDYVSASDNSRTDSIIG
jgi:L-aspartate oxidase